MITHGQARGMAETQWGTKGTTSRPTTRKGAFYFSCSGHGGFIIDGRCLTQEEREGLSPHASPTIATEYRDPSTDRVHRFLNPFRASARTFTINPTWVAASVDIFSFEEDCAWCLPVIFADIRTEEMTDEDALGSFDRYYAKSNHSRLKAKAVIEARSSA